MSAEQNRSSGRDLAPTVVDGHGEIMNSETAQMVQLVNFIFLCTVVGFCGIVSNTINMMVFCKQGFHHSMTINFMGLAVSDQCCLITLEWFNIFINPLVVNSDIPFASVEVQSMLGGWPHVTFGRITGWITAYITAERCLCITAPLAVKRIITPARTTSILVLIYLTNMAVLVPEYSTSYIGWKFYPATNRTLLGVLFTSNSESAEGLVFFLHAVLVLGAFVCVTLLTILLVVKLKMASRWRQEATGGEAKVESMSKKDKNAAKMVVMISCLLICMYSPGIALSLARFIQPKFGIFGEQHNLFVSLSSFGFLCNAINSSVNIFMYYSMSSQYREAFHALFARRPAGRHSTSAVTQCYQARP